MTERTYDDYEARMHLVYLPGPEAMVPIAWGADKDGTPVPNVWGVTVEVVYRRADGWRTAKEGERCRHGAGGPKGNPSCSVEAAITWDRELKDKRKVAWPYCKKHAGGRVALEDGTVVEPAVGEA